MNKSFSYSILQCQPLFYSVYTLFPLLINLANANEYMVCHLRVLLLSCDPFY